MMKPAKETQDTGLPPWWHFAAFGLLVIIVFSRCFANGFVNWDDEQNFLRNPAFHFGLGRALSWAWTTSLNGVYQPLSWMLLLLQGAIGGVNPRVFHIVSVCLHAANGALALAVASRLGKLTPLSGIVLALFWVHPLMVETVVWASCQPYLWCGLFSLLSVYFYARDCDRNGVDYRMSCVFFAMALLCKAIAFTLPALFLCLTAYRDKPRRRMLTLWTLSLVTIGLGLWARRSEHKLTSTDWGDWLRALGTPGMAAITFVQKTIFPASLSAIYPSVGVWLPVVGIGVMVAGAWLWWRAKGTLATRLTALSMVALLFPGMMSAITEKIYFADRFSYFPLTALGAVACLAVGTTLYQKATAVAVGGLLIALTQSQIPVWKNSEALWKHTLLSIPDHPKALANLGTGLMEQGRWEESLELFRQAVAVSPDLAEVHNNLGICLMQRGQIAEAAVSFRRAVEISSRFTDAMNNWAYALFKLGQPEMALEVTAACLANSPNVIRVHENRARIFESLRRFPEAVAEWKKVVELNPTDPQSVHFLALALAQKGDTVGAVVQLRRVLASHPNFTPAQQTLRALTGQ